MRFSTRYGLTGIAALGLLAGIHQVRSMALKLQAPLDYLLGVLPNFAAAIAITFVLLSIWSDQNPRANFGFSKRAFFVCASISGLGLLAWELFQKVSNRLVFDPHDMGATVIGIGVAFVVFVLVSPRRAEET